MNSNKLIAIDFGSSRILAMAAEVLESGAVRVISCEGKSSDDVKWGIIEKPSGASFKVSELIKLLKNSAKVNEISHVSTSINGKGIKLESTSVTRYISNGNLINENLLDDLQNDCIQRVSNSDTVIFDIAPAAYMVDGVRMDEPVGYSGRQITGIYNIVSGDIAIKAELERCFDRTNGVTLEYAPLSIEAISTVLIEESEKKAGVALIHMGATTTTLAIYHDEILQRYFVIPFGAKNITRDIQELGISEENAEKIKCLKGCAMESMVDNPIYIQVPSENIQEEPIKISTRFLATIIESRLEETLTPVFNEIKNLPYELEAGIVLSGGGTKLNNLVDYIEQKTNIYTRIGDHKDWLEEGTEKKYHDPVYSQLLGTILLHNEHRILHPLQAEVQSMKDPQKNTKGQKGKNNLSKKITAKFIQYFSDENKMNFPEHENK